MSCEKEICEALPQIASAFGWIPYVAAAPIAIVLGAVCKLFFKKKKAGKNGTRK